MERESGRLLLSSSWGSWEVTLGGDAPGPGGARTYLHEQAVASDEWHVQHDLATYPQVAVIDSAGTEVQGDVEYPDAQHVVLRFSAPFSGRAALVG